MHDETLKVSGGSVKTEIERPIPDNHADAVENLGEAKVYDLAVRQLRTDYRNDERRKMTGTATITQVEAKCRELMQHKESGQILDQLRDLSFDVDRVRAIAKEDRPAECGLLLERLAELATMLD